MDRQVRRPPPVAGHIRILQGTCERTAVSKQLVMCTTTYENVEKVNICYFYKEPVLRQIQLTTGLRLGRAGVWGRFSRHRGLRGRRVQLLRANALRLPRGQSVVQVRTRSTDGGGEMRKEENGKQIIPNPVSSKSTFRPTLTPNESTFGGAVALNRVTIAL